jgi:hypothetical protein
LQAGRAPNAIIAPAPSQPPTAEPSTPLSTAHRPHRTSGLKLSSSSTKVPNDLSIHHTHASTLSFLALLTNGARTLITATMPPKSRASAPQTAAPTSTPARTSSSKSSGSAQDIVEGIWNNYLKKTPQRVKLLDSFMAFLVVVGALQFLYCLIVGNFVRNPLLPSTIKQSLHPK